jgi:DNA-binding NtrC family response regulator
MGLELINKKNMDDRRLLCIGRSHGACSLGDIPQADGWQVTHVDDASKAAAAIATGEYRIGIALILNESDAHWFRHIEELFSRASGIEWIAVLEPGLLEQSVVRDFIAGHFLDFHTLPLQDDKFLFSLGHVHGMASLLPVTEGLYEQGNIVGASAQTRKLVRHLGKVALVDTAVLVTGETGTGKELSAKEIHEASGRHAGPFVAVNCAELPPTLIHAELFGYEKGAFTGAARRKIGYLEQADGGTIFLDEIGDLPPDLQILLLRFLQQKVIRRVGGTVDITVNARVIAATHVDLPRAVSEGRFREDLYHRLNVLRIHVPALREREEDIEALANYFFEKYAAEMHRNVRGFTRAALQDVQRYHWPGNVRELMNRIRRALVMCEGRMITAEDLGIDRKLPPALACSPETLEQARSRAEREALSAALQQAGGNLKEVAATLAVSRATLYRLLEKHGLTNNGWPNRSTEVNADGADEPREAPDLGRVLDRM